MYEHKVKLRFITPGQPMEKGYIESFLGKFREECLNEHWFQTVDDSREPSKHGGSITTRCARIACSEEARHNGQHASSRAINFIY